MNDFMYSYPTKEELAEAGVQALAEFDEKYDYRSNMPQFTDDVRILDEALERMEMSEVFGGSKIIKANDTK